MGQGLGKNSPISLSFGKDNYEALIDRHGQWVRWRVATKCPCVKPGTQQPDIHCQKCAGLGYTYDFQKEIIRTHAVMITDSSGVVETDFEDGTLVSVYNSSGRYFDKAEKLGRYISLNATDLPCKGKGEYLNIVLKVSCLKVLKSAPTEKLASNFYRIKGLQFSKNNVDNLYHTVAGDIIKIGKIVDSEGTQYEIKELRQDCFFIEPSEEVVEPVTVENVEYIPPNIFVVLNQNFTKTEEMAIQKDNGEAILSFPYGYNVADGDVITVLSGTYTQKSVVTRKAVEYDVIAAYFVDEITSCIGKEREFKQGVDFLLVGNNRIKWLCEDSPETEEAYSITFKVLPTYKVFRTIPQIRTSENQRMPKKAILKLYDTYGEKKGINRQ